MITHSEVTAGLWSLIAASSYTAGHLIGKWRGRLHPFPWVLDEARDFGADLAVRQAVERVEQLGMVLRLSPDGRARWCDAGSQWDIDGARASIAFDGAETPVAPLGHGRVPYAELADERALQEDWAGRMLYSEADWHLEAAAHEQAIERWISDGGSGTMPRWVLTDQELEILTSPVEAL